MTVFSHAHNNPEPGLSATVEGGTILDVTFAESIRSYNGNHISALFEAAGLGKLIIFFPAIPDELGNVPLNEIKTEIIPGTYSVRHVENYLLLPEEAIKFSRETEK